MGDNHPVLNSHWRVEELLQRLVQGGVIDQFAWPYYVSIPLPPPPKQPFLIFRPQYILAA
jgi:hypothetical protein